jgi:hypothetical protein
MAVTHLDDTNKGGDYNALSTTLSSEYLPTTVSLSVRQKLHRVDDPEQCLFKAAVHAGQSFQFGEG